jgi:hypothetical protein
MKSILFAVMLLGLTVPMTAQTSGSWKTLAKITFRKVYDDMLGMKVDQPVFTAEVRALEGKEITLRGYIVPTNGYISTREFVLSAYPINVCFFCGGAGPESVIEVHMKDPIKFTSEPVTLKGKLELNENDPNRLIYSLYEVKRVAE